MFDGFESISFEYPYFLLLIVLFVICDRFCKAKVQTYYMPHLDIFESSSKIGSNFLKILKYITIIFSVIALSSPVKELDTIKVKKDGIDIVLALDTSGSMRQTGFNESNLRQNRWEVVQGIVQDFIDKRLNDSIGIVVFGTNVMTASALTYDKKAQKNILEGIDIGIAGEKTALVDSVATSVNILKSRDTKTKIIILLTDGDDTVSSIPLSVVEKLAKQYKIKIYSIAIATNYTYILDSLSLETNGKTFRANSAKDLENIYESINKLEKSKIEQNKIVRKEYLYFYPLFISFFAFLFFIYFKNKRENI